MNRQYYEKNLQLALAAMLLSFILFTGAFFFLQRTLDLLTGSIVSTFLLFGSCGVFFTVVCLCTALRFHQYIEPEIIEHEVYINAVQKPRTKTPEQPPVSTALPVLNDLPESVRKFSNRLKLFVEVFCPNGELGLGRAKTQGFTESEYDTIVQELNRAGVLAPNRQGVTAKFSTLYVNNVQDVLTQISKLYGFNFVASIAIVQEQVVLPFVVHTYKGSGAKLDIQEFSPSS